MQPLHSLPSFLIALTLVAALPAQQARPPVTLDDALERNEADGLYSCLASDGHTRIVVWQDDRVDGNQHDLFLAGSTDDGLTWGPELQITQAGTWDVSVTDPELVIENGIFHLLCTSRDVGSNESDLMYMRSTDQGFTWTALIFAWDIHASQIAVDGNDVVLLYNDRIGGKYEMYSRWSDDGGLFFDAAIKVDSTNSDDYDMLDFDVDLENGTAHTIFVSGKNGAGEDDVWYAQATAASNSWGLHQKIDGAAPGEGLPLQQARIEVDQARIHAVWSERDRLGSGDEEVAFYRRSHNGLIWLPETKLGGYTPGLAEARWVRVAVDGDHVAITWNDDRSGTHRQYVVTSRDGGATLDPEVEVPFTPNGYGVLWGDVAVSGNTMAVQSVEWRPSTRGVSLLVSANAGQTWSDPIDLEPNLVFPQWAGSGWRGLDVSGYSILSAYAIDGPPHSMRVTGIRLPVLEFERTANAEMILHMSLVDDALVGETARWVASTATGLMWHPENPSLAIQLGPSQTLTKSLQKANLLSATVLPDGTSQTNPLPIKASYLGNTYYLQGWVNERGLYGGPPSDVLTVQL